MTFNIVNYGLRRIELSNVATSPTVYEDPLSNLIKLPPTSFRSPKINLLCAFFISQNCLRHIFHLTKLLTTFAHLIQSALCIISSLTKLLTTIAHLIRQPLPSTTMKIAMPQVLKPMAAHTISEEDLPEIPEQPRMVSYKKQESSFIEKVEVVVQKGVSAIDPLNIFAPCIAPTRLVVKHSMFHMEEPYDILECRTNDSYLNLQVRSNDDNTSLVM